MENQACKGSDIKATREGEDNPKLDQMDRGNNEATREGEDTPKLDLEDKGDTKATREGEDAAKLDLEDRGDREPNGNRYKRPVITKVEKNPGKKGDTREYVQTSGYESLTPESLAKQLRSAKLQEEQEQASGSESLDAESHAKHPGSAELQEEQEQEAKHDGYPAHNYVQEQVAKQASGDKSPATESLAKQLRFA